MPDTTGWFRIGHTTHADDLTGCTVILFDAPVPAAVDVRGGAPGTRETDVLGPGRRIDVVDAVLLTGGSAFGLATADGVMRYLADRGRGVPTSAGPVPIVPAAVIYDLANGNPRRPTAQDGYAAVAAASEAAPTAGRVGAGTGATVAKLGGSSSPGGLGIAVVDTPTGSVTAVVVVNAVGDIRDPDTGAWLARSDQRTGSSRSGRELAIERVATARENENTTIGAVLLSQAVDRTTLARCCVAAHDALARCVVPAHTMFDGDTFFAASRTLGDVEAGETLALASAAEIAVERAIVSIFE